MDERDGNGTTMTHFAAFSGCVPAIKYCAANGGGGMDLKDIRGMTVANYAENSGSEAAVEYCKANGGS
jgi:hypothetical protein